MIYRRSTILALFACGALALAAAAPAQQAVPDFSGTWQLQTTIDLPANEVQPEVSVLEKQGQCTYEGTAELTQDVEGVTGPVDLDLVSGPAECPPEMLGTLSGNIFSEGGEFFFNGAIAGEQPQGIGVSSVEGTISPNPGGSGSIAVTQGPFQGAQGSWTAQLLQSVLEIPTLTAVGLTLLTLTILAAGALMLRQAG